MQQHRQVVDRHARVWVSRTDQLAFRFARLTAQRLRLVQRTLVLWR